MNIIGKRFGIQSLRNLVANRARTMASAESFMTGNNIGYIEQMYEDWKKDPNSIHTSWNAYFNNVSKGITPAFIEPPTLDASVVVGPVSSAGASVKDIQDHLKVYQLISAYQLKGHEIADFDPLSKS